MVNFKLINRKYNNHETPRPCHADLCHFRRRTLGRRFRSSANPGHTTVRTEARSSRYPPPPRFSADYALSPNTTVKLGAEYSRVFGATVNLDFASQFASNGAFALGVRAGRKDVELVAQTGFAMGADSVIKLSLATLSQYTRFNFASGEQFATMHQHTAGATWRFRGAGAVRYMELYGFASRAPSRNFADVEVFTDTATLYELNSVQRRAAGSRTAGAGGKALFNIADDPRWSIEAAAGAQQRRWDTLVDTGTTTQFTGSGKLNFPLGTVANGSIGVRNEGSRNTATLELNGAYGWGIQVAHSGGRTPDTRLGLSYQVPLDHNFKPVLRAGAKATAPLALTAFVAERPLFAPTQIDAREDTTTGKRLIVAVDKTGLPAGSTVNTATGDATIPLPGAPGVLVGALNTTTGQAVAGTAFALVGNALVVRTRALEGALAAGVNNITVTLTNFTVALVAQRGSVKLVSVTVTPVAPADTTPPALTSSAALGTANIGATISATLTFSESLSSFTFGALPAGMTANVVSVSGSTVNISVVTNAAFRSFGAVNIPFTTKDSSPAQNALTGTLTATINDVAPTCSAIGTMLTLDDEGGATPARVVTTISCQPDVVGRTLNYSLNIVSQSSVLPPFTGPATMSIDASGVVRIGPTDANSNLSVIYQWSVVPQSGIATKTRTGTITVVDTI